MYRLLAAEHGEIGERRAQLAHPAYAAPELLAERPNQVYSWDITKLKAPATWTYFDHDSAVLQGILHACRGRMLQGRGRAMRSSRRSSFPRRR